MPLLAVLGYLVRLFRRPIDVRLKRAHLGSFAVVVGVVAVGVLWSRAWPNRLPLAYRWGELAGVEVICLLTASLLLATRARWLEPLFGGLDRMYLWHKRTAVLGVAFLLPHKILTGLASDERASTLGLALGVLSLVGLLAILVTSLPRAGRILRLPYERWLLVHRFSGLFVLIGALHGLALDRVLSTAPILKIVFLLLASAGTAAYGYSEFLMRRRSPAADYAVESIRRPSDGIVEVDLKPIGSGVAPRPGQFVFVSIGGDDAWREHPFSIRDTRPDGRLSLSVRALGADTRRMHARLRPGLPARITGPYGMFDYTLGAVDQIWIAGGIGVVPFLGWLNAAPPEKPYRIDLFYSAPSAHEAVYLEELKDAARRWPEVRVHPVFTRATGRLTGPDVVATMHSPAARTDAFLCGPSGLVSDLTRGLLAAGFPTDRIHAEHFTFR